jgi:hypothetical protein
VHDLYDGCTGNALVFAPITPHHGQGRPPTLHEMIVEAEVLDMKSIDVWPVLTHIKTVHIQTQKCKTLNQVRFVREKLDNQVWAGLSYYECEVMIYLYDICFVLYLYRSSFLRQAMSSSD